MCFIENIAFESGHALTSFSANLSMGIGTAIVTVVELCK